MFTGPDYAHELAEIIAAGQYRKKLFGLRFSLVMPLLSSPIMYFALKYLGLLRGSVVFAVPMLIAWFFALINSSRLYGFLDGDLRSTSEYMRFKTGGRKYFFSILIPALLAVLFFRLGNYAVFWAVMGIETVITFLLALDINIKSRDEFGPGNGRYTFGLMVSLRKQYTAEEIYNRYMSYTLSKKN